MTAARYRITITGMARPKLPPGVARHATLPAIRVTAVEAALVRKAAQVRGLAITDFCRAAIVRAAGRVSR